MAKYEYRIENVQHLREFLIKVSKADIFPLVLTIDDAPKNRRTLTQNRALHLWLTMLADYLNDSGLDMKRTLKHDVEIPWTTTSAKNFLWRPIQKIMISKESTAAADTSEYNNVYLTLSRYLMQKHGLPELPLWPSAEKIGGFGEGKSKHI